MFCLVGVIVYGFVVRFSSKMITKINQLKLVGLEGSIVAETNGENQKKVIRVQVWQKYIGMLN